MCTDWRHSEADKSRLKAYSIRNSFNRGPCDLEITIPYLCYWSVFYLPFLTLSPGYDTKAQLSEVIFEVYIFQQQHYSIV